MSKAALSRYRSLIEERSIAMKEHYPHINLPCETDHLFPKERLEFSRLMQELHAGVVGAERLRRGIYSVDDQRVYDEHIQWLSLQLKVDSVILAEFHLDVLKGMRSLQTGSWLCT